MLAGMLAPTSGTVLLDGAPEQHLTLSGQGLRDVTRIAAGALGDDPEQPLDAERGPRVDAGGGRWTVDVAGGRPHDAKGGPRLPQRARDLGQRHELTHTRDNVRLVDPTEHLQRRLCLLVHLRLPGRGDDEHEVTGSLGDPDVTRQPARAVHLVGAQAGAGRRPARALPPLPVQCRARFPTTVPRT